jgi:hypothetical protein
MASFRDDGTFNKPEMVSEDNAEGKDSRQENTENQASQGNLER